MAAVAAIPGGAAAIGNDLDNHLVGNSLGNLLDGRGRQDTLDGHGGDDLLRPGFGSDTVTGGAGLDTIAGTLAELANTRVEDFTAEDRILVEDLDPQGITLVRSLGDDAVILRLISNGGATAEITLVGDFVGSDFLVRPASEGTGGSEIIVADAVSPGVTVKQATAQSDPAVEGPILFDVRFDGPVTGLGPEDILLSGTAGATTAVVSGSGSVYSIAVSGMTGAGTVIVSIAAGAAQSGVGAPSLASTSLDNVVDYAPGPSETVIMGTSGGELLLGTDAAEIFLPLKGIDTIKAAGGDDVIRASIDDGLDFYLGGSGNDTIDYSALTRSVAIRLGTLFGTGVGVGIGKQCGVDTLTSIENVIGSRAGDTICGNGLDNVIDGGGGKDIPTGGDAWTSSYSGPGLVRPLSPTSTPIRRAARISSMCEVLQLPQPTSLSRWRSEISAQRP